jgi:hypothetical protein
MYFPIIFAVNQRTTADLIAASRRHRDDQKGSAMLRFYAVLSWNISAVERRENYSFWLRFFANFLLEIGCATIYSQCGSRY